MNESILRKLFEPMNFRKVNSCTIYYFTLNWLILSLARFKRNKPVIIFTVQSIDIWRHKSHFDDWKCVSRKRNTRQNNKTKGEKTDDQTNSNSNSNSMRAMIFIHETVNVRRNTKKKVERPFILLQTSLISIRRLQLMFSENVYE